MYDTNIFRVDQANVLLWKCLNGIILAQICLKMWSEVMDTGGPSAHILERRS